MNPTVMLSIADTLNSATSIESIECACGRWAETLGYEHYIYGAYLPIEDEILILDGFPGRWREHYIDADYLSVDPTVRHCSGSTTVLDWSRIVPSRGRTAQLERELMSEAASHGLRKGISVPVHGPGTEWGMLSFSSPETDAPRDDRAIALLSFLACLVHEAMKRLSSERLTVERADKPLTDRERECLQWTANGKTAWEISKILSLSESTVTFHLKNAIQKMEVTNRPHAVAKAIAQSRITLF